MYNSQIRKAWHKAIIEGDLEESTFQLNRLLRANEYDVPWVLKPHPIDMDQLSRLFLAARQRKVTWMEFKGGIMKIMFEDMIPFSELQISPASVLVFYIDKEAGDTEFWNIQEAIGKMISENEYFQEYPALTLVWGDESALASISAPTFLRVLFMWLAATPRRIKIWWQWKRRGCAFKKLLRVFKKNNWR